MFGRSLEPVFFNDSDHFTVGAEDLEGLRRRLDAAFEARGSCSNRGPVKPCRLGLHRGAPFQRIHPSQTSPSHFGAGSSPASVSVRLRFLQAGGNRRENSQTIEGGVRRCTSCDFNPASADLGRLLQSSLAVRHATNRSATHRTRMRIGPASHLMGHYAAYT